MLLFFRQNRVCLHYWHKAVNKTDELNLFFTAREEVDWNDLSNSRGANIAKRKQTSRPFSSRLALLRLSERLHAGRACRLTQWSFLFLTPRGWDQSLSFTFCIWISYVHNLTAEHFCFQHDAFEVSPCHPPFTSHGYMCRVKRVSWQSW